jgi:hypothetical protein
MERRADAQFCYLNQKVCIGARSGAITILDFSAVGLPPLGEVIKSIVL